MMIKILEALKPELFEGSVRTKTKHSENEKSRDFYGYFPGTKKVIRCVSEQEYRELYEEE